MYENIGGKIKVLANVLGWIFLIAGVIVFLKFITNTYETGYYYNKETHYLKSDDYIAWIGLIGGALCYISSWFIYGLGQLIEDTALIRTHFVPTPKEETETNPEQVPSASSPMPQSDPWTCSFCDTKNGPDKAFCENCGVERLE